MNLTISHMDLVAVECWIASWQMPKQHERHTQNHKWWIIVLQAQGSRLSDDTVIRCNIECAMAWHGSISKQSSGIRKHGCLQKPGVTCNALIEAEGEHPPFVVTVTGQVDKPRHSEFGIQMETAWKLLVQLGTLWPLQLELCGKVPPRTATLLHILERPLNCSCEYDWYSYVLPPRYVQSKCEYISLIFIACPQMNLFSGNIKGGSVEHIFLLHQKSQCKFCRTCLKDLPKMEASNIKFYIFLYLYAFKPGCGESFPFNDA